MGAQAKSAKAPAWMRPLPELDEHQFRQWVLLLERRVGVFVPEDRRSFLATGLKLRMQEIGCHDYQQYYDRLVGDGADAQEWSTLVDRLTVHETRFFRHAPTFRLVTEQLLPQALAERPERRSFQAWSVGCATGEETYSLAMVIDDHLRGLDGKHFFGVTGTDVSRPALETARRGRYPARRRADIEAHFQERYCVPAADDGFEIHPLLRKRVCFSQLNVMQADTACCGKMDLIVCQNLLIYFERKRRTEIVSQLAAHLRPGGVLLLGPGELSGWKHADMEPLRYQETLAYRRVMPATQAKEAL